MDDIRLKILHQCAIESVIERTSESFNITMATRVEKFSNLHISAFMDIDKTIDSLKHILEYKKEVSNRMLMTSNEKELELYAEALKHAESLIKKVLGMCL